MKGVAAEPMQHAEARAAVVWLRGLQSAQPYPVGQAVPMVRF